MRLQKIRRKARWEATNLKRGPGKENRTQTNVQKTITKAHLKKTKVQKMMVISVIENALVIGNEALGSFWVYGRGCFWGKKGVRWA